MAVLTPTAFWNKWGDLAGLFKDNNTEDITESRMRDFVTDMRDSIPTWSNDTVFAGFHADLSALNTAVPNGTDSPVAVLTKGIGTAGNLAFWDNDDGQWREISLSGSIGLDDLTDVSKGAPENSSASTIRIIADPNTDGSYNVVDYTPPDQIASQVPVTPLGNLISTNVLAALYELQGDVDLRLLISGGTLTGPLNLNADPANPLEAATKQYVDNLIQGVKWKENVKAATTANITLSGTQTVDGISLVANDRVLVKDQSTGSENGIYIVAAGAWSRSTDTDSATELEAATVVVSEGTVNADRIYNQTADSINLGTTSITWVQIGQITTLPTTTKGDIIVHNGTTNVRLPVGTVDGSVLRVRSATASGLEYGLLLNGLGNLDVSGAVDLSAFNYGILLRQLTVTADITSLTFNGDEFLQSALLKFTATATRSIEFGAGHIFDRTNNNATNFSLDANERITLLGYNDGSNWNWTIFNKEGSGGDSKLASQDITWAATNNHNVNNGYDAAVFGGTEQNSVHNITNASLTGIHKGLISYDTTTGGNEITFQKDGVAADVEVVGSANSVATLGTGDYTLFAWAMKKINGSKTIIVITQTDK